MLTLYSSSNKKKLDLTPSHSDTLTREIMGDAVISLSFVHWEHIPIEVGDYVVWEGERFTILSRQFPLQVSSMEWRYQLKLFGESSRLKRYHVLSPDGDPIFTLTSPASEHLRLIVEAMNECEGGKEWKVGSVVTTDNLVVDYNCTTLDAALQLVADAAHTEWWLEGKTINLTRCEWGEALPLAYGEGLTNLEQGKADGHKVYTRIYPIGSSRNIDSATYGAARLQLPDKAKFVDLPAIQELGRIDHYERDAFSHIYPRRIGTITSMRKEQRKVEGKDMEVYFVKDDSLNFDPAAHLMSGKVMQFSFQEGADLAGREFECNWHAAQREFELITQWLSDGTTQLPNASLPPKVGDRYLLWNIKMPDSYLRDAEQELLQSLQAYNEKHHLDLSVYKARTDFEYFERHDVKLRLGQRVTLSSKEFFADGSRASRVSKIVQHLDCSSMMDIEMSDTLSKGVLQRINDEVGRVEQQVRRVEATLPEILRIGDPSPATDNNIYSAARTHREFLSKNKDDVAHGQITFSNGATFGNYLPAMLGGAGANIDERGNAEVESIKVRSRMEVAELVVNRQTTMDADILLTEGDTVEGVNVEKSGDYTLALKREWEGYVTSLTAGAVVRGIYNDITRGGGTFETTWLKVLSVDTANNAIRVSLYPANECPAGVNHPPRKLLKISRWGHVSDELRQATYLLSSRDQRIALITNVTKPIIDASNISSWQGKLDGLTWRDAGGQTHQLTGYGNIMGDAYVSGSLHIGGQLTGAIADKVNELGEENLLLEGNVPVRNSDYMTARYSLSKNGQTLKEGEKITAVMKAHLAGGRDRFGAFVADGWISVARFEPIGNDLYKFTHVWPTRVSKEGKINDNRSLQIYAIPSNSATTTIEWVKLVRGSHASLEFSPSPEDVANAPILKARAERIIAEVEAEKSRLAAEYAKVRQLAQWSGEEGSRVINLNINYKAKADELLKAAQSFIADGLILTSIFDKKIPKSLQDEYRQTAVQLIAALREMQGKIEVGGVNLFGFHKGINLKCESWESDKLGLDLEWAPDIKGVRARVTKAGDGFIRLENYGLREHVICTFSFRMNYPRTETKKIVNARIYTAREAKSRNVIPQAGWQYVTITALGGQLMTYNNSGIADIHFQKGNSLQVGDIIEIADIKIERGTVATAWTPAPEDVEWEKQQTLTKINNLQTSLDKAKSDLTTITDDAWRDGIITAAEGKSLTKAKLEVLRGEKSYLLARADAVLAAHPQLATTHPTEYNQIREGSASNQNARWYYLLYAEGMINACEAFLAGNSSYIFNGGSNPTATRYEDLFSLWLSSKSLSEWYEFSRNSFEAAIIMADRGKDGARGERGLQGLQGERGERGIPGERGADGRNSYTHIAYADTNQGGGFSQQPRGKAYMGVYVDNLPSDSNDPSRYKWSLIKGQKGDQGVQGARGADGRTPYFHTAYASSSDGRTNFHLSDPNGRSYIGVYTDYTESDSNDPSRYTWSLIKGIDGVDGSDGTSVNEVKLQYALSQSATQSPATGWSEVKPEWRDGWFLWVRFQTIYSNGQSSTTPPTLDETWQGEKQRRLLEDDLKLKRVNVGAEKGVSFGGRFDACSPKEGGGQEVRAFLNGLTTGARPAFAAGVMDFGTPQESYATALYHDGSGKIGVVSFASKNGEGSMHIFDRNDPRRTLVEFTDKPMPTGAELAQQSKETLWMGGGSGSFTKNYSVTCDPPTPSEIPSTYWANGYNLNIKPVSFFLNKTFTIGENRKTGDGRGRVRLTLTPDNQERARFGLPPEQAPDQAYLSLVGKGSSRQLCRIVGSGTEEFDLSQLKDLPEGTYDLSLDVVGAVGTPRFQVRASSAGYAIDPDKPYTAICGDGFMAYQSKQQYTFIKEGVLHAKGDIRIPGLLAAGVVEEDGTFRSKWGSRLGKVQHRSRGEYLIHHTLGHTRYSVIINPLGNGGLKVAQLAAHADHVAWIYIKDVQSGCQMSDSMFTFAIIGHDD